MTTNDRPMGLKQEQIKTLSVELEDGRVFTFNGIGSITEHSCRIPQDNTLPAKWPIQHQVQAHLVVFQRFRITRPGDDAGEPIPESPSEPQASEEGA